MLSASAVSAQTYKPGAYYTEGEAITSEADLTSGLYFIKVHAKSGGATTMDRGEKLLFKYSDDENANKREFAARFHTTFNVPDLGTNEAMFLWQIDVTDNVVFNEYDNKAATAKDPVTCKTFSVKGMSNNKYWSMVGTGQNQTGTAEENNIVVYPAKDNMKDTDVDANIGQFRLVALPEDYTYEGNETENTRFFIQLTNGLFRNPGNGRITHPYVHSNAQNPSCLSYWGDAATTGTSVQLEFVKAVENEDVVGVTVNFPKFNMDNMSINVPLDATSGVNDLKEAIDNYIAENGGMYDVVYPNVTSFNDGDVLTVGGTWVNALVPGHVYRFNIRPDDSAAHTHAVRYVRNADNGAAAGDVGFIMTRNGGAASFNTLELERFWFFQEVQPATETEGGVYTIHSLARPYDKGVYVADANNEKCSLLESATEFLMVSSGNSQIKQPGDFAFRINAVNGVESYVNDVEGKLGVWKNGNDARNDGGSLIRLSSLVDEDFSDFAEFAPADLVAAAKADPTAENVLALFDYFTGRELEAAIAAAKTYTIGDEVGEYNNADHNFAELLAAAEAVAANAAATDEEKAAAAASISEYSLVVNMPTPGRFYRFKNRNSGKLLSSLPITKGNQKKVMPHEVPADGIDKAGANTVFYLHEDEAGNYILVSYADGKVMSKWASGQDWNFVLKGSEQATANMTFGHRGKNGGFIICADPENHRHLFHNGTAAYADNIGCGTSVHDGYQWDVIPVTSLPVPIYMENYDESDATPNLYFSVHSPVALENIENVDAYTGVFTGTKVEKTKIEGVIPAHTPVLMEYKGGAFHGEHGDYLFFPIANEGISTTAETASSDINGDIFAFEKKENTTYYTLHETTANRFRIHDVYAEANDNVENNVIPGFKAHIAVPATQNPEEYFEIVDPDPETAIDEIEADAAVKAAKVYDLQGRQLAAPAKGINIIGGQKVLVK